MKHTTKYKNRWIFLSGFCLLLIALLSIYFFSQPEIRDSNNNKYFTVEVTHRDGDSKSFTYETQERYLGQVLLDDGLITGEDGVYGLYVLEVDGERAVYETDGAYWAFYINGTYATQGVDQTPISDGDTYTFVYTPSSN